MKAFLVIFLHCMLWQWVCLEDRSNWADPNDMIHFDHSSKKMHYKEPVKDPDSADDGKTAKEAEAKPSTAPVECPRFECPSLKCPPCPPAVECVCEQAALPLLRKYTQTLLTHIDSQRPGSSPEEYNMHVTLSSYQIKMFENFVSTGNQRHVHDVHEILTKMIDRVVASRLGPLEKMAQLLEHKMGLSLDRLIQFFLLGALASVVLLIEIRLQIAWRRRVGQLIVLMFVISVPWTWYDLYKEAEIKQESKVARTVPEDCKPDANSYWKYLVSMVTLQEDKCLQYYESVMVDPIVKVPPTKAIAVTFVRFFVAPLKDIGAAFSEFIRALLVDLPLTLYPVACGMLCLLLFLLLVFMFGYTVRLPFYLLTIERNPQVAILDNTVHQAVTEANQQALTQLEQLQVKLESTRNQIVDKLQHLDQVQQLAIEHSQSYGPPSPVGSPSIPNETGVPVVRKGSPSIELGSDAMTDKKGEKKSDETDKTDKDETLMTDSDNGEMSGAKHGKGDMNSDENKENSKCSSVDTLMPDGVVERNL